MPITEAGSRPGLRSRCWLLQLNGLATMLLRARISYELHSRVSVEHLNWRFDLFPRGRPGACPDRRCTISPSGCDLDDASCNRDRFRRGGFIKPDHLVHSEVQLAARLRKAYPVGVDVESFGSHQGKKAREKVLE